MKFVIRFRKIKIVLVTILVDTNVFTCKTKAPLNSTWHYIKLSVSTTWVSKCVVFFRYDTVLYFDGENTASQTGFSAGLLAPTVPTALWNKHRHVSSQHHNLQMYNTTSFDYWKPRHFLSIYSYYSGSILRVSGFPSSLAIWLSCIPFSVNFLCTFIGIYAVEKAGRRVLTLLSFIGRFLQNIQGLR